MKTIKGVRGEVWYAYDEQGKQRPYIIVSNDELVAEVDHVIAKVTSQRIRNKFDVPVEDWKEAGLSSSSIVRCSKLRTIHNELLDIKLGTLSEHDFEKVISTIKSYF